MKPLSFTQKKLNTLGTKSDRIFTKTQISRLTVKKKEENCVPRDSRRTP
jgi:hypothetical protein